MIQSAIFSEIILDDKILGTESSQASRVRSLIILESVIVVLARPG